MSAADATGRRRRVLATAGGLAAACALAAAVALGGGPGAPAGLGPADALAQAARQTAAATSGVATTRIESGAVRLDIVLRFDGDDAEATIDQRDAGGAVEHRVLRLVDGVRYERLDDGAWRRLAGEGGDDVAAVRAQIGNRAVVELARAAADVVRDGDAYRATLAAQALAGIEDAPLGLGEGISPEAAPIEITAGDDGLIRRVSVDTGSSRHTVSYSELGTPQAIAAPETGEAP
jgi:hypothetical protein